ncbi:MAG: glycosyltransferase family 2 protein [Treponema sp.]|nr:glycosyltransferase family 2 protein [Treponema sp.]
MIISLGIIALNEELYLPSILEDVLSQTFPHSQIDFVLIDSLSADNTKRIMEQFREQYSSKFHNIRVLENAGKWQANGWNVFIDNAVGDILVKVDAHAHIPCDFIKRLIDTMEEGHFDVLGGKRPTILKENTKWSEILLEAENSLFGSGIAVFRTSDKPRFVKSVFHGAYRKEVFQKAGNFNERLRRTEDNEIHWRIRQKGFLIRYEPSIISYQYARPTLRKMMKQKFSNGYWIGKTVWICPRCLSLYHFAPVGFFVALILTGYFSFISAIPLISLIGLYGAFNFVNTLVSVIKNKKISQLVLFVLFPLLHISYGVGTLLGLFAKHK